MTVQLTAETDADLYQYLRWNDFYLLLQVLHLLQDNVFLNTFRWLLLKRENNIFNNYDINGNMRCLHGNKGWKRYWMNRSNCLLLIFFFIFHLLFTFVIWVSLISETIVVLLRRLAASAINVNNYLLLTLYLKLDQVLTINKYLYQDKSAIHSIKIFCDSLGLECLRYPGHYS